MRIQLVLPLWCLGCVTAPEASHVSAPVTVEGSASIETETLVRNLPAELARHRAEHAPGTFHRRLDPLVGHWDLSLEIGGNLLGRGTADIEWSLGGRWLAWETVIQFGEDSYTTLGFVGYDLTRLEYTGVQVSSFDSAPRSVRGKGNLRGEGLVLELSSDDRWKERMRLLDENTFTVEGLGPEGEVVRRTTYVRR